MNSYYIVAFLMCTAEQIHASGRLSRVGSGCQATMARLRQLGGRGTIQSTIQSPKTVYKAPQRLYKDIKY